MTFNLDGRTVLVTGAARGIGRALTFEFLKRNCQVVAVGRDAAALETLASEQPDRIHPWPADLSNRDHIDRLVHDLPRRHPAMSVVVNNAGVQAQTNFLTDDFAYTTGVLRSEIAVNFEAVVLLSAGLLPHLAEQPSAAIVNITSALAIAPKKSAPTYCAAKAGLRSFTKALRYQCEDGAPSIRVVDVVMALVDTDMTAGRGSGKMSPAQAARATVHGLLSGRDVVPIGRSAMLMRMARVAPGLADRVMRNG